MSFNPATDASRIAVWDDGGGGASALASVVAVNRDGTGGAPANGGAAHYWLDRTGNYFAAANAGGTNAGDVNTGGFAFNGPTLNLNAYNTNRSSLAFSAQGLAVGAVGSAAGAATIAGLADATTGLGSSTAWSFIVAWKCTSGSNAVLAKVAAGTNGGQLNHWPGWGNFGVMNTTSLAIGGDSRFHVSGMAYDSGRGMTRCFHDGASMGARQGLIAAVNTTDPMMIGCQYYATTHLPYNAHNGEIFFVGFYNTYLTHAQTYEATNFLTDAYGQPRCDAGVKRNIFIFGNSLMSLNNYPDGWLQMLAGNPGAYTNSAGQSYGLGGMHNCGYGGMSTTQQITYNTDVTDLMTSIVASGNTAPFVGCQWEITNDGPTQANAGPVTQRVATVCEKLKSFAAANAMSLKLVVAGLIDRATYYNPNISYMRLGINRWLGRNATRFADAVVDWPTDYHVNSAAPYNYRYDGISSNTEIFSDGVHFRQVQYAPWWHAALVAKMDAQSPAASNAATSFALLDLYNPTWISPQAGYAPGQQGPALWLRPIDGSGNLAHFSGTVTITSSNAGDTWVSPEPDFSTTTNACTFTYTGDYSGRLVIPVLGSGTGARTLTITSSGLTIPTRTITVSATTATTLSNRGNGFTWSTPVTTGATSPPVRLYASTSAGVPAGLTGPLTVTLTPTNCTVAWLAGYSGSWGVGVSEGYFTITPTGGTASVAISSSGTNTLTAPSAISLTPDSAAEAITLFAASVNPNQPPNFDTLPVGVLVTGVPNGSTVNLTFADSQAGSFYPSSTQAFTATSKIGAVGLIGGSLAVATHSISVTNDAALSNPTAQTIVISTVSYTGSLSAATTTLGTPVTMTLTPSTTIGTDMVSYSDGGGGGTFSAKDVFNSSAVAQTFTYANNTPGTYTITPTSTFGLPITGGPFTVVVTGSGSTAAYLLLFAGLNSPITDM